MNKLKAFLREVNAEVRKVVYPKKDELIGSTWVVVVSVLIMSFYLGLVDWGLSEIVKSLLR